MIQAEVLTGKDNKKWIKVSFNYHPLYVEHIKKVPGAIFSNKQKVWAVPYENKEIFETIMGDFLIIWNDGTSINNVTGIDESSIPSSPIVNYKFKNKPWGEFQVKGFNLLYDKDFLILADEQGLGKSFQVLTAIEAKKLMGKVRRGVIICKATHTYMWFNEVRAHTNLKPIVITGSLKERCKIYNDLKFSDNWDVVIVSYETFRNDILNFQLLHKYKPLDFCVLDEAHKIKNPRSKIGTLIHRINFKCKYILTGTPLPNSPIEAYNYLKWGGVLKENYYAFLNKYTIKGSFNQIIGYKNIRTLQKLIKQHMLRRLKKDKLKELPEVIFKVIPVEMNENQKKLYVAIENEIINEINSMSSLKNVPNILAKLMRLQQVTDYPAIIGADIESEKLKALDELLEDLIDEANEKVIVFSKFKTVVEMLQNRYKKYNPVVIHGDVGSKGISKEKALKILREKYKNFDSLDMKEKEKLIYQLMVSDRQRVVDKFQNDPTCKLFIGCAPACREGLTLTAATHVIFYDLEWSYAYVEQAYARAHRIGQKNAVTVHYLICKNTVDEHIFNIVNKKKTISETILGDNATAIKGHDIKDFVLTMLGKKSV